MSIKYIEMAFKMPTNSVEKLVLLALSDYADDDGYCFPGYSSLIDKTSLSRSALAKTLGILEGAGFFEKKPHASIGEGRKVNTFRMLFNETWFEEVVTEPSKSTRLVLIESIHLELIEKIKELRKNKKRAISTSLEPRKVVTSNSKSTTLEHEPSLLTVNSEPSLINSTAPRQKAKKKKPAEDVDQILNDFGISGELAADFKVHRKTKKAAITKTAMKGFAREAAKAGITIAEAVEIAVDRGWTSFNSAWDWKPKPKIAIQQHGPSPESWADTNFLEPTAAELATGRHLSILGNRK